MPSNYPGGLDNNANFPVRQEGDKILHTDYNDHSTALIGLEQVVGPANSGNLATLNSRMAAVEASVAGLLNGGSGTTVPSHPTNFWGFEDGTVEGWAAANGTAAVDPAVAHSGTQSLKVTQSGSSQAAATVTNAVTSGSNWLHRVWVRGDGSSAGKFVQATIRDVTGSFTQVSVPVKLSTAWQEVWALVPATGASVVLGVQGFDLTAGLSFWIDDASVSAVAVPAMSTSFQVVLKNGLPTHWTGTGYYPTPIGLDNTNSSVWGEPKQARYDMQDIAAADLNAIRVYYSPSAYSRTALGALLDECLRNGIDVWMGYYAATNTDYSVATGSANRTAQQAAFTGMVTNCRYHPAVVGYLFGNEMNYNYGANTTDAVWYPYLNTVLAAGKAIDPARLMSTANGEIAVVQAYDAAMTSLDVWGANIYRNTTMAGIEETLNLSTSKPFLFTEYGNDRYDTVAGAENQQGQANMVISLMRDTDSMPNVCGSLLFEWNDEYWKGGNVSVQTSGGVTPDYNDPFDTYSNEAYYGITYAAAQGSAAPRTKTLAYYAIQAYRQQLVQSGSINQVNALIVNAVGREDGLILRDTAGNRYRATVNPRYLSASDTGAVRITPWYPFHAESAASPILLLDGTGMTSVSSLVTDWRDSSGVLSGNLQNHPSFSQGNASNQPAFNAAALNGLNTLSIAGTGQFMEMNNFPLGNNVTVFVVAANQRTTLTGGNFVDVILSTRPSGQFRSGLALSSYNSFFGTSARYFQADTLGSAGTATLYVNGSTAVGAALTKGTFYVMAASVTLLPPFSYLRLGQYTDFGTPYNGKNDIAEIRVYQGAMNSTQVGTVTTALRAKYSI